MKSCISSSFNSATKHRILLTDVPIHNDLSLLYSLFDFATCSTTSVFGTLDNFNLKFATPILAALRQDANEEDIHLAQEAADELREWSCKYYLRREQVYDEDDVDDVLEVVEEKNKVQEKDEEELMVLTDDEKVDKMEDTYMDTSVFHLDNPQTKNMAHHLSFAPVNSSGVEEVTEKMTRQFSIMAEEVQGEVDQTPPPAKNNCRAAHGCPSGKHMSRAVEIRNCRCTLQESQMDQYSDLLLEFR